MPDTIEHHPAILRVSSPTVTLQPGYFVEFGGAITRVEWANVPDVRVSDVATVVHAPATPPINEEYFEWLDLLEAVEQAEGTFVMVELGAGYGRWSVRGAIAARAAGLEFHCVAVEGEPTHARWLRQHFTDNGLNPDEHELIWAAVGAEAGFVPFTVGQPSREYGQRIEASPILPPPGLAERRRLRARAALGRPPCVESAERAQMWVPCMTLAEVLAPYPIVDLIDIDIQAAELPVLAAAIHRLDARVRRIHIGTHGERIEAGLRQLFTGHGWQPGHDYHRRTTADTPFGRIAFKDGVQSWSNPHVGRPEPPLRLPSQRSNATTPPPVPEETAARVRERLHALKEKISLLTSERDSLRERLRALKG